jgi:hypothetical protein
MRHFHIMDVDSVDGTGPTREPDNYKRLFDDQLARQAAQWSLFS